MKIMEKMVKGFATKQELEVFIFEEVQKSAKRQTAGRWFDASDLESYLMIKVWAEVMNNAHMQNEAGVRRIIKLRSVDFFKSPKNIGRDYSNFSAMGMSDDEGSETAFEETFVDNAPSVEDTVINSKDGQEFLVTLKEDYRRILELTVDGYNQKDICGIVYPTMAYESSRKKVQRAMKEIGELALDFGFWN